MVKVKKQHAYQTFSVPAYELGFPFGVDVTETLILVNNALSQAPNYPDNADKPRMSTDGDCYQ